MKSNQPAFQRRFTPKEGGEGLPKIAYTRRLCLKRGTLRFIKDREITVEVNERVQNSFIKVLKKTAISFSFIKLTLL